MLAVPILAALNQARRFFGDSGSGRWLLFLALVAGLPVGRWPLDRWVRSAAGALALAANALAVDDARVRYAAVAARPAMAAR